MESRMLVEQAIVKAKKSLWADDIRLRASTVLSQAPKPERMQIDKELVEEMDTMSTLRVEPVRAEEEGITLGLERPRSKIKNQDQKGRKVLEKPNAKAIAIADTTNHSVLRGTERKKKSMEQERPKSNVRCNVENLGTPQDTKSLKSKNRLYEKLKVLTLNEKTEETPTLFANGQGVTAIKTTH